MKILLILNDGPNGSEKAYNALRIVNNLNKENTDAEGHVFLMADDSNSSIVNQTAANGYYSIERMLKLALTKGAKAIISGSYPDARGLKNNQLNRWN